jgi:membrane-bound lytic murein transglycosylase A
MVNQTMNTASSSATSTSRKNQAIAKLPKLVWVAAVAVCAACSTLPPVSRPMPPSTGPLVPEPAAARFRPVAFEAIPGWAEDTFSDVWPAFSAGCAALVAQSATATIWGEPCAIAATFDPRDAAAVRAFFERHFTAYRALAPDGTETGLVTGYYEPLLNGSRVRSERNRYPLYAPPDDLLTIDLVELYPELKDKRLRGRVAGNRVVPYWPRADIEAGRAPLVGKELVFVDDPVEAFFLQIQGSGRVQLDEGGVMRVGYADQNGQPFRSIARVLIDRGELAPDRASMQAIKQWAQQHPEALPALLDENPSYVFFREVIPDPSATIDGPIGTLGVPLAGGRSIAVDARSIPLGAPVFLATTWPLSARPLNRLVLAQDTGGAIRGPLRVDFFWGFGEDAAHEAGSMKQESRLWLLWPKSAPPWQRHSREGLARDDASVSNRGPSCGGTLLDGCVSFQPPGKSVERTVPSSSPAWP